MKKLLLCLLIATSTCPLFAMSAQDISQAYAKSYTYEKMGNYNDALKSLTPVATEFPSGYTVNLRMGFLNFKSGKYANSLASYDKAILAMPSSVEPKLGKMLVLMSQAKYAEAEALGYQILNIDYMNYYANLRLAYVLRVQKKTDLADKICIKMLATIPTDVTFLTEFGALKFYEGQYVKADAVFQDVLILDPENVDAHSFLAAIKKLPPLPAARELERKAK